MKKLLLIIPLILTLIPLFHTGLFDVHDPTSILRFATLLGTLGSGQFPATWTNSLNQGYGYPLFLYYAPVFSYLGVFLKLFLPTYLITLKVSLVVLVSFAGFGMYQLMKRFLGEYGTLVAATAYTLLPYHASTLYVRGSYAEGVTWALLPWLLYFWSSVKRDHRWVAITSLVTSLFFLSHNSLPFAFIPFLLIWILLFKTKDVTSTLLTLILSALASFWFLLPVLFERGLVQLDQQALLTNYSDHFLHLGQLWHSPWGYGGSAKLGEVDGMSFMLGKFQLALSVIGLAIVTLKKKWNPKIIFFVSMLLFYAFMTTTISSPVWQLITGLQILQFPWRLLAFASFALAAITGYLVEFVPEKLQMVTTLLVVSLLLIFNLKFFQVKRVVDYNDSSFLSQEKLDTAAKDKIPEYLPSTMSTFPTTHASDSLSRTTTSVSGSIDRKTAGPLTINTAYMPQWQLTLNGLKQPISPNEKGFIATVNDFQPGNHTVSLTWHRTQIENIGIWISGLTVIVMIGLLII